MGIPKFYRWLSERYPHINQDSDYLPETDNFYLNINEIIQNAVHSDSLKSFIPYLSPQKYWSEVWEQIFKVIENLVQLVKPKQLLYLSVDGVAPRAKMNKQRQINYKFVYETQLFIQQELNKGNEPVTDWFNFQQIYPGTSFMYELNSELEKFIKWKIQTDPLWQSIDIVFSASDVIGQAVHKIQQYIRCTNFPPNTRNCLYGQQNDLILLGLITHQPFTYVLVQQASFKSVKSYDQRKITGENQKFQCCYLNVLREYFREELKELQDIDIQRFVEDFVVMILLIENDYLPSIPTFQIQEGAVDSLLKIYKQRWNVLGYLSQQGKIHWQVLNEFFNHLSDFEIQALHKKINRSKKSQSHHKSNFQNLTLNDALNRNQEQELEEEIAVDLDFEQEDSQQDPARTAQLVQTLQKYLKQGPDKIKKFYYSKHLKVNYGSDGALIQIGNMLTKYLEGLQWVVHYYFDHLTDWQWYYPYHFAPMISDFSELIQLVKDIEEIQVRDPFRPLDQLLAVIQPKNEELLPVEYDEVIRMEDFQQYFPPSPIIDYDVLTAKIGQQSLKVLLPFLPLEQIQEITLSIAESPEIRARNHVYSDIWYRLSPETHPYEIESIVSTYPSFSCNVTQMVVPYNPSFNFTRKIQQGTVKKLPGFPSLHYLQFQSQLRYIAINVFNITSRTQTVLLKFQKQEMPLEQAYNTFFKKQVYCMYPLQELGEVFAVSDSQKMFPQRQDELENYQMTQQEFLTEARSSIQTYMYSKQGMMIDPEIGVLIHYYPLLGYKKSLQGHFVPQFDKTQQICIPIELVRTKRMSGHPREPQQPAQLTMEFPIGSTVMVLNRESYGSIGEVVGYDKDKFCPEGSIRVRTYKDPLDISETCERVASYHYQTYHSIAFLGNLFNLPVGLLSRILGSFRIAVKTNGRSRIYDIGLNLKSDKLYSSVLRWARWAGYWNFYKQQWEFSQRAKDTLQSYCLKFPELLDSLKNLWNQHIRAFRFQQVFAFSENPLQTLQEVAFWVHSQYSSKLKWSTVYSQYLGDQIVENLRNLAQTSQRDYKQQEFRVNPGLVFNQSAPWATPYIEKRMAPMLGHRVINMNSQSVPYVPFGAEGTVVALIGEKFAEVLFDETVVNSDNGVGLVQVSSLLSLTKQSMHILRKEQEKLPLESGFVYNDQNFKPKYGKKPTGPMDEELKSLVLGEVVRMNPTAPEFVPEMMFGSAGIEAPASNELPLPQFIFS